MSAAPGRLNDRHLISLSPELRPPTRRVPAGLRRNGACIKDFAGGGHASKAPPPRATAGSKGPTDQKPMRSNDRLQSATARLRRLSVTGERRSSDCAIFSRLSRPCRSAAMRCYLIIIHLYSPLLVIHRKTKT